MRTIARLGLVASIVAAPLAMSAAELKVARVLPAIEVPGGLIVGRAVCSDATWMLVESSQLLQVGRDGAVAARHVTGLSAADRPWGLACLSDGTLWTMATWRNLARIDVNGAVRERIDLHIPRSTLFGVGERLLFQQAPPVPGTPALMTSPPRQPYAVKEWPGLTTPKGPSNLANCGVGLKGMVPCWLVTATRFTVSDGATFRSVDAVLPQSNRVDREAPIRDVALAGDDYFWIVAGGYDAALGRPAGVRIVRGRVGTSEILFLDLKPAARLIVRASEKTCLLLTVDGTLIEVGATP